MEADATQSRGTVLEACPFIGAPEPLRIVGAFFIVFCVLLRSERLNTDVSRNGTPLFGIKRKPVGDTYRKPKLAM